MIDLGGVYAAQLDVYDADNELSNAATIALTITQPDLSVATVSVPNPPTITGQYEASFKPVMPGRHTVRWTTENPDTAYTDVFDVQEPMSQAIFSLADAKQQLGMAQSYTADDAELRAKLTAITRSMELYKHETIVPRRFTQIQWIGTMWWRSWPTPFGGHFRLGGAGTQPAGAGVPVIQLQQLQSADGRVTWDPNNLEVHADTGECFWTAGPVVTGRVIAVWLAGYQIIPYNYVEAAKVLLQHVWEVRRGPGGANGVVGPEELQDYRHFTALPRKAMEWLGPPRPVIY